MRDSLSFYYFSLFAGVSLRIDTAGITVWRTRCFPRLFSRVVPLQIRCFPCFAVPPIAGGTANSLPCGAQTVDLLACAMLAKRRCLSFAEEQPANVSTHRAVPPHRQHNRPVNPDAEKTCPVLRSPAALEAGAANQENRHVCEEDVRGQQRTS